jgi:hypothetical protein
MNKTLLQSLFISMLLISTVQAQFATVGVGVLTSDRPLQTVAELNVQSAPFFDSRVYLTSSWTDESIKPTLITAVEHSLLQIENTLYMGAGVGLLWLEFNDYKPKTMLVSSAAVPLPVPRLSFVMIGSVLPFDDYDWSLVLKGGWAFWFEK